MRLPRATFLSAVALLKVSDAAPTKVASDVQGQVNTYDADDWHNIKKFGPGVKDEERLPVSGELSPLEHAMSSAVARGVTEDIENTLGVASTSLGRNSDEVTKAVASAPDLFFVKWKEKEAEAAQRIHVWLEGRKHPDEVYKDLKLDSTGSSFTAVTLVDTYTWLMYIDEYTRHIQQSKTTPVLSLHEFFSRFSDQMIKTIAMQAVPSSAINRIETHLKCYWLNSFKTKDDVTALLRDYKGKNLYVSRLQEAYGNYFDSVSSPEELRTAIAEFKMKWKIDHTATQPSTSTKGKAQLKYKPQKHDNEVFIAFDKYVDAYNSAYPSETLNLLPVLVACFGEGGAFSVISAAKAIPETASKAKLIETEQIRHWVAEKSSDTVLKLIDFNSQSLQSISTLFQYFDEFSKQHFKSPFDLLATLRINLSDKQLARIAMGEQKNPDVERLKNLLFLDWFNNLKSDDEVSKLTGCHGTNVASVDSCIVAFKQFREEMIHPSTLNLPEGGPRKVTGKTVGRNSDYDSSMLAAYEMSIRKNNEKNPKMPLRLLAVLTARFGDSELAAMIDSAKLSLKNEELVTRLENEQIQYWVDAGKSPDEVFSLLDPTLQARPFIDKWIKFYDEFIKRRPEHSFDPIVSLMTRYNDNVLASIVLEELQNPNSGSRLKDLLFFNLFDRMITHEKFSTLLNPARKKNTKFDSLVKNYQHFVDDIGPPAILERVREWCKTKSEAVGQTSARTGNKGGDRDMFLYDGKVFAAYDNYIHSYNKVKPFTRLRLLAALTIRFGDRDASTMILAAKMHPDTAKAAESVEAEQIKYWVKAGKTPDQVFELLNVDLQSLPLINKWLSFISEFRQSHREFLFNPIVTLSKRYDIKMLVRTIAKEGNSHGVEQLKDFVIHDLFNSMQSNEKVLKQLGEYNLNDNTVKSLYTSYKQFRNKMANLPDLTMLQNGPSFELLTPDMTYRLKSEDSAHDGLLLDAYDTFVNVYNEQNPTNHLSLLAVLITRFGDHEVLAMIESAKSNSVAVETAKLLEVKLIQHWVGSESTPDEFTKRLLSGRDGHQRIFTWVKCIDRFLELNPKLHLDPIKLLRKYFSDKMLATLVVTATPELKRDAERVQDMLLLDWFNSMLTSNQFIKLLNIQKGQRKFAPILKAWKGFHAKQAEIGAKLVSSSDETLYGSVIDTFATYVRTYNEKNPTKQLSLLALLTAVFGDGKLLAMIDKAKSFPKTLEVAKHLESEQILFWVKREKNPIDIYELMGFNTKSLHFIYKWIEFSAIFCKHHPNPSFDPINVLKKHFSDHELAAFLVDATSKSSDDAKRLEPVLFTHWFNNLMTREKLEELLGLNEASEPTSAKLLDTFDGYVENLRQKTELVVPFTPAHKIQNHGNLFYLYDAYVRSYNEHNPATQVSLFALLHRVYGDKTVVKMIDEAKLNTDTRASAERVEAEQFKFWEGAKKSPAKVVDLLESGSKSPSLVHKLVEFFDNFYKRYPDSSFDPIALLKRLYSDAMVAKIVVEATSNNSDDAKRLEAMLFSHWFNNLMTRKALGKLLGVNEASESTFAPLLDKFDGFVENVKKKRALVGSFTRDQNHGNVFSLFDGHVHSYNEHNPATQMSLFALLYTLYGDKAVVKMIDEAKLVPHTLASAELVEIEQFQHWVNEKKTLEEVVELLLSGSRSLRSISRCAKFFDIYSKHHPGSLLFPTTALKSYFSDVELITLVVEATPEYLDEAKRLEAMLFRDWFNRMMTRDDLFKRLNVDEEKKHTFASLLAKYGEYYDTLVRKELTLSSDDLKVKGLKAEAEFAAFVSRIRDFNEKNPTEQLSLLAALTACYGDHKASTMIGAAKSSPSTKNTATFLDDQQVQFWVDAGRTPSHVFALLDIKSRDLDMLYKWIKFCDRHNKFHPEPYFDPISLLMPLFNDANLATYATNKDARYLHDARQLQVVLFRHWYNNLMTYDDVAMRLTPLENNKSNKRLLNAYTSYVKNDDLSSDMKWTEKIKRKNYVSLFTAAFKHVEKFNLNNPTNQKNVLAFLTHHLEGDTASMVLEAAKLDKKYSNVAVNLEEERSKLWLKNKKSPHDVLKSLGFDKMHEKLQPRLFTLVKYVDDYSAAYPDKAVELYDVLREHDRTVARAFVQSTDLESESIKERVLGVLFEVWSAAEIKPSETYKFLQLHLRDANVIKRREFQAWAIRCSKQSFSITEGPTLLTIVLDPKKISVVSLVKSLEKFTHGEEKVEWTDKSGKVIDLVKGKILPPFGPERHLVEVWGKYFTMLSRQDSPELVGDTMTFLRTIFTQEELITRLVSAPDNESTQLLRTTLFDFWFSQRVVPKALEDILNAQAHEWLAKFIEKYASHPGVKELSQTVIFVPRLGVPGRLQSDRLSYISN